MIAQTLPCLRTPKLVWPGYKPHCFDIYRCLLRTSLNSTCYLLTPTDGQQPRHHDGSVNNYNRLCNWFALMKGEAPDVDLWARWPSARFRTLSFFTLPEEVVGNGSLLTRTILGTLYLHTENNILYQHKDSLILLSQWVVAYFIGDNDASSIILWLQN